MSERVDVLKKEGERGRGKRWKNEKQYQVKTGPSHDITDKKKKEN